MVVTDPDLIVAGRRIPGDKEMRVSHETIYQSLFVQGRGALRKELWHCLRTGRAVRRPQGRPASTKGQIRNMVMISDRPAEVEDSHRNESGSSQGRRGVASCCCGTSPLV